MSEINFFSEEIPFQLSDENIISSWLLAIVEHHQAEVDTINYIFCSDDYLLEVNKTYLNHDYYTDIITFDNSQSDSPILSDIFISIDRVTDNASSQNINFDKELHRVMAHGLLHLIGFNDKTEDEKILMRQNEDTCLSLLKI
ncbi:MAG: rRNA maturation RNase YbeY [Marinoscillum sp.]